MFHPIVTKCILPYILFTTPNKLTVFILVLTDGVVPFDWKRS